MKHLHIVSFHWPFPPINGGLMEVFYKIKWLHAVGVKIHLHAFVEKDNDEIELKPYCAEIHTYARKKNLAGIKPSLPYIVSSRRSGALLQNLQKDNYPILFEGVHTTHLLYTDKLPGRQVFIRLANVEQLYYARLANAAHNKLKKTYYTFEAKLLKAYEDKIANKAMILTLSENDRSFYSNKLNAKETIFMPAFTVFSEVESQKGKGAYVLYHGNLSVAENEKAAIFIINEVADNTTYKFIIAGNKPSKKLQKLIVENENVSLVANPDEGKMKQLISQAQIHLLPSYNNTGVKLKLLHAAYLGRHIITNNAGVIGSGLQDIVHIADTAEVVIKLIHELITVEFSEEILIKRKQILARNYNNEKNAIALSALLQ